MLCVLSTVSCREHISQGLVLCSLSHTHTQTRARACTYRTLRRTHEHAPALKLTKHTLAAGDTCSPKAGCFCLWERTQCFKDLNWFSLQKGKNPSQDKENRDLYQDAFLHWKWSSCQYDTFSRISSHPQAKILKMMDDNKQLAQRIDGAIQSASQEVTNLRSELSATSRRLTELGATESSASMLETLQHNHNGKTQKGHRGAEAAGSHFVVLECLCECVLLLVGFRKKKKKKACEFLVSE